MWRHIFCFGYKCCSMVYLSHTFVLLPSDVIQTSPPLPSTSLRSLWSNQTSSGFCLKSKIFARAQKNVLAFPNTHSLLLQRSALDPSRTPKPQVMCRGPRGPAVAGRGANVIGFWLIPKEVRDATVISGDHFPVEGKALVQSAAVLVLSSINLFWFCLYLLPRFYPDGEGIGS